MTLFSFKCKECGYEFEKRLKFFHKVGTCPVCSKKNLEVKEAEI